MQVKAQNTPQTCTGSLGDPVINQNFGSGTNPGAPLASGITNMTYTTDTCPEDGFYTIASSVSNCYNNAWHNVTSDHTGNPNGYMMIINASFQPSVFFTQTANGLCPNTTYEFSAYILNLITLAASIVNNKQPNITFSIETLSGQVLTTATTGTLLPTDDIHWYNFGIYFTTPANTTDVVVKMTNNAPGGYGNDLILDDITFRACGPVIQAGIGLATGPVQNSFCVGQNVNFTMQANVLGNTPPPYQWQVSSGNNLWQDIVGATGTSISINSPYNTAGNYLYRMGVSNGSGITSSQCRVYSSPITIQINPLPTVPPIAPQTVCSGSTLQLTATGGSTYQWSGPGISSSSQNPLIINNVTQANAGTYTVVAMSDKGCPAAPVQALVKVEAPVVASVGDVAPICAGASVQLNAAGGLFYKWTPSTGLDHDDIANPVATPKQTTTYTVVASNGGCSDSKTVTVTVNQLPAADGGGDKKIFEGQSVKLNGTAQGDEITSISWAPATALSDPTSLTPVANPTADITYTLTVTSQNCGASTSTVFVRVYQKVHVPSTFTPNNDGINDYWNIDKLSTYPEGVITVFDRYGHQVFQSRGYSSPWDGKRNGVPLPAGTYYYIIDLNNNTPKIPGWVLIIR